MTKCSVPSEEKKYPMLLEKYQMPLEHTYSIPLQQKCQVFLEEKMLCAS